MTNINPYVISQSSNYIVFQDVTSDYFYPESPTGIRRFYYIPNTASPSKILRYLDKTASEKTLYKHELPEDFIEDIRLALEEAKAGLVTPFEFKDRSSL